MIIPDTNVWFALTLGGHAHHGSAAAWFDTIDESRIVRFTRATQRSLLRLLTTAVVLAPYRDGALTNSEAWQVVRRFDEDDRTGPIAMEPRLVDELWHRFAARDAAAPKLWMDAYLAAFAVASAATFVTFDTGFRQFEGLDLQLLE